MVVPVPAGWAAPGPSGYVPPIPPGWDPAFFEAKVPGG